MRFLFIISITFLLFACQKDETTAQIPLPTSLSALKSEHPRLMLTNERIAELKKLQSTDPVLDKYIKAVIASANSIVTRAPLTRTLIGPRLLDVSRELLNRTSHLALAYHFSGDKKYVESAVANMRTVCEFSDWNPSHFLDVAEMSNGVAIGYDWLYPFLSEADRTFIRNGLKTKGLDEYKKIYETAWWAKGDNNWNQVCNGALIVASLAIAETDLKYADEYIPKAIANLPYSNKFYAPDGAWYEGPGYWAYATEYLSYGMSALQTALGTLKNLETTEGLSKTGFAPMLTTGPTNYIFNFADSGENSKGTTSPAMFFMANTYSNTDISNYLHNYMSATSSLAKPFHVVWYRSPSNSAPVVPLDHMLRGEVNDLVVMRSSWTDKFATWIGVKSGTNSSNHSHLDLGSFELDAGGVRWAKDLGSDDYNLDGYWTMGVGGKRWSYYRLGSLSHNVPILGNKNQYELAKATFSSTSLNVSEPNAILDLSQAYRDYSSKSTRKISLVNNRKDVVIEDDFVIKSAIEVAWGMTTDQSIEILPSGKAILRNATITTKTLEAEIISPTGAKFTIESASKSAPEKLNTGTQRLMVRIANQIGNVKLQIKLSPKG
ncbi:MAG: DUF4962 domain-containing protein [Cytophagia bacterium]|nr:DUF4962 domain-containing protein [Cytophagia bacterium]